MLGSRSLVTVIPTTDPARARAFFEGVLGLRFVSEDRFAIVLDANGAMLRITDVGSVPSFVPQPFTIAGWLVADIERDVRDLQARGVRFEHFEGMPQDELGIWRSPSGARVAWFKDPDGNILSVSQHV